MPGRAEGKVAFITGAGRGQGRSHAVRLAQEGADIIAIDICHNVPGALPMATADDLAETVKLVEAQDRRIVAVQADVRDFDAVKAAVDDGVAELGRLDIVVANAGIASIGGPVESMAAGNWKDTIDINLTGLFNTARAAVPHLIAGGRGGSIVLTTGIAAARPFKGWTVPSSILGAMEGLTRALAVELAPIRVNTVSPGVVKTDMWNQLPQEDREGLYRDVGAKLLTGRVGEADEVAETYLYLMRQTFSTGQVVTVDGGGVLV